MLTFLYCLNLKLSEMGKSVTSIIIQNIVTNIFFLETYLALNCFHYISIGKIRLIGVEFVKQLTRRFFE